MKCSLILLVNAMRRASVVSGRLIPRAEACPLFLPNITVSRVTPPDSRYFNEPSSWLADFSIKSFSKYINFSIWQFVLNWHGNWEQTWPLTACFQRVIIVRYWVSCLLNELGTVTAAASCCMRPVSMEIFFPVSAESWGQRSGWWLHSGRAQPRLWILLLIEIDPVCVSRIQSSASIIPCNHLRLQLDGGFHSDNKRQNFYSWVRNHSQWVQSSAVLWDNG